MSKNKFSISNLNDILAILNEIIMNFLLGCPMVSTINFERPEPTPATAALGGVPPAPSRSLYLRYLDLTDCTRLMDEGLHVVVRNAPHLQQLYLRRCVNVTGKIF